MANTSAPFGARPVRYRNGAPWTGQATPYYCPSDYDTALYVGDPVVIVGDSNDAEFMGFGPGQLSEVNIATAGATNRYTGFVTGFLPTNRDSLVYKPASTEAIVMVCDDPNVVFWMQDDGDATITNDTIGLNADMVSGTGSTVTGRSGWVIDGSTAPAADATYQLLLLNLARLPDNEVGDYAIWEVMMNLQTYEPLAALGIS